MSMGFSLGADVPFLLFQQPALVTGIGEKLEAYPDPLPYHLILVYPGSVWLSPEDQPKTSGSNGFI